MRLTNVIFENRVIENERLELSDPEALYFLGDELTLRHCTLVLRAPTRRLHVNRVRFIDCTIVAKHELKNLQWSHAHLRDCQFQGRFLGNDFGNWRGTSEGSIENCDFTGAHLDQTRFLNCDVRTIRFPSWPCFTIFDPVRRWRSLSTLPWPGDIGPVVMQGYAERPTSTAAVTYSAPDLAKRSGATPEAIKAVLAKLDGVYY